MVTFGGDMISPSVLSGIDKGAHMIDLANAVGFDVAVLGNHEFDFGSDVLRDRLAESDTVWLAGQCDRRGPCLPRNHGHDGGGEGRLPDRLSRPGHDRDTRDLQSRTRCRLRAGSGEAGAVLAQELKSKGADIVIALTHQGLGTDLELLRQAKGIDVVLGGHDHLLIAHHDGRHAVMKAGSQGRHVGVLTLTIDCIEGRGGTSKVVWTPDFRLRSTADTEGDAKVAAKVRDYQASLDETLDVVIGETAVELSTLGFLRGSAETAFGNLLADAMREATGADIALTNGGGIRGDTVYPPGSKLTRKMVLTELPFGNKTVVLRLTGAQLRAALENGVSRAEKPSGRFPQVSGLAFTFDARRPPSERVTSVTVAGAPLDDGKTYTLATNSFLANGGDDYRVFKTGEVLVDSASGSLMAGQLIDHIIAAGSVAPKIEGRIARED